MSAEETATPDSAPPAGGNDAGRGDAGRGGAGGRRAQLKLHHLRPAPGSKRRKVRVGRGESGRRGKTAGRGMKGRLARGKMRPGFEGGQTPLQSRIPHLRGFKPINRREFTVVNVDDLHVFQPDSAVSVDDLRDRGLARKRGRVKVLGRGELDKPLVVQAHAFSAAARAKIEAAGGQCEVVE